MTDQLLTSHAQQQAETGAPHPPDLSSIAFRLYCYAAARPHVRPHELADALDLTSADIDRGISELIGLRLLSPVAGRDGELTSVSPELAGDILAVPLERQANEQRRRIAAIRTQMRALSPAYETQAARRKLPSLEIIADRRAVLDLTAKYAGLCTSQAMISRPRYETADEMVAETIACDESMLTRGVGMRILYQHGARYHPPTVECSRHLAALGAEIRAIGDRIPDMTVFDQSVGIMEAVAGRYAAVLVRESVVLNFMIASFDISWVSSDPFFTPAPEGLSDDLSRRIVSLLAEGNSDKIIARRLGISERTCQRYVRKVMDGIGAKSRFQAGYLMGMQRSVPTCGDTPGDRQGGS